MLFTPKQARLQKPESDPTRAWIKRRNARTISVQTETVCKAHMQPLKKQARGKTPSRNPPNAMSVGNERQLTLVLRPSTPPTPLPRSQPKRYAEKRRDKKKNLVAAPFLLYVRSHGHSGTSSQNRTPRQNYCISIVAAAAQRK